MQHYLAGSWGGQYKYVVQSYNQIGNAQGYVSTNYVVHTGGYTFHALRFVQELYNARIMGTLRRIWMDDAAEIPNDQAMAIVVAAVLRVFVVVLPCIVLLHCCTVLLHCVATLLCCTVYCRVVALRAAVVC